MTRTSRDRPNELAPGWPDKQSPHIAAEAARKLAVNLRASLNALELSVRALERKSGVDEATIRKLLAGSSWTDIYSIALIEAALERPLYDSPAD
ncbi:hypothetical protein AB0P19_07285 [Microbacterium oleivorans]|uniref:hypothetical protein n=1 Tax=Microbacterium TaxID=33882 RepID=UPI0028816C31|nr:hypothetical protein [Microbacterium sp. ARD31]MDT0182414.1 hypothetical protein [Microbacterium sp. ARD31]